MVDLVTNRSERLVAGSVLYAGSRRLVVRSGAIIPGKVDSARAAMRFEGVDDRDAAEALRGAVLTGDRLGSLGEDEWWAHEIIGSEIVEVNGRERGWVAAVQANPAHDLLVTSEGYLVPVVFVVATAGRRVVIDPPAGLFEAQE